MMVDDPTAQFPLACQDYLDGKHGGSSPENDAALGKALIKAMTGTGGGAALVPSEHRDEVIKEPPEDSALKTSAVVLIVVVARVSKHGEDTWVYALAAPLSPEFQVPAEEQIELSEHKFAYLGRTAPTPLKFQPGARIPVEVDKARLYVTEDGECLLNLVDPRVLDPKGWPKGADKFAEIVAKMRHENALSENSA